MAFPEVPANPPAPSHRTVTCLSDTEPPGPTALHILAPDHENFRPTLTACKYLPGCRCKLCEIRLVDAHPCSLEMSAAPARIAIPPAPKLIGVAVLHEDHALDQEST
eukprot:CAMPEP_0115322906 /NCGR_PEP_ID=MMETSP0270-20121206/81650_1 /TAXON_ID=71861 /ORGANISM="Scrippsiella trochoidea, Strain CCMP3099" /LENGTH=106 /DNA_ID=CAMNT_0002742899 /DNA_START=475 /DNA_END=791 /DNA_ORIENTATION=-